MASKLDDPALDDPDRKIVKKKVYSAVEQSLQGDHVRIMFLATLAALLHMAISAGILFMGYSPNQQVSEKYSTSIVLGAFGALITVIWAAVASWEAGREFSKPECPDWEWHNTQFMTAVSVMFGMSLFLWPTLLVFMLHSLGKNFFVLVTEFDASLVGVLWFHVGAFLILLILNVGLLYTSTKTLRLFQVNNENEAAANRPVVPGVVKVLTIAKVIGDIIGCADLILIIANTNGNSGVIFCLLVQVVCLSMGCLLTYKLYREKSAGAQWFIAWRATGIIHVFVGWVVFWLCAGLLVLVGHLKVGFFAALVKGQTSVVYFEIVLFAVFIFVYIGILYSHARCMFALGRTVNPNASTATIELSVASNSGLSIGDLKSLTSRTERDEKKSD